MQKGAHRKNSGENRKIRAEYSENWDRLTLKNRDGESLITTAGRGVYFRDPDGHYLEVITQPYGSGG